MTNFYFGILNHALCNAFIAKIHENRIVSIRSFIDQLHNYLLKWEDQQG